MSSRLLTVRRLGELVLDVAPSPSVRTGWLKGPQDSLWRVSTSTGDSSLFFAGGKWLFDSNAFDILVVAV